MTREIHPRLLCDEMLMRLARWLRAAGYDAALVDSGAADRDIYQQAVEEGRQLLTCDREFLERREADRHVLLLGHEGLDRQAARLREELGIDWLAAPFSRCLVCNEPLQRAAPLPDREEVSRCAQCDRLYWEGSHVRRMRERLEEWADAKTL